MSCRVLRIGIFFDGTGNSRVEKATYSNVAKLHDLYEVKQEKQFVSEKIYITGLGTVEVGQGTYMQVEEHKGTGYYGGHSNEGIDALAAGDCGAREYACIGVHSDIGGGYAPIDREELLVSMPLRELDKRRTLEQHGWKYDAHRTDRITGIYKKQRVVCNKLQDVTLHMMHQQALLKKVPFKPLSIPIDPALGEYANHALKHPASLHSYAGATAIKETYAHQSATHPLTTTLSYPLRAREDTGELIGLNTVNVRDRRIQRDVYTNQTSRAVSPA
jgi:hypothetical protein